MPSLQSIALLAAATTASANYLAGDYEFGYSDLAARDAYDGDLIYERDLYEDIDNLMQHYQRDLEEGEYSEGQFIIREAKGGGGGGKSGGAGKAVSSALKGANKGATAFGNIGTGLTGISDVVNTFKGNGGNGGNGKRDLGDYYEEEELFVRDAARGGRPSAASIGHGLSQVGHGASAGAEAFGHVGDGLTGISNIVGLFKGNKGKRDLDDLYEGITLYTREPKGRSGSSKGFLSSLTHGHGGSPSSGSSSSGSSSSSHGHGFGSFLHGANAAGHGVGRAANAFGQFGEGVNGLASAASQFLPSQSNTNSRRDLEDLYDDTELSVRDVFDPRSIFRGNINGHEISFNTQSLLDAVQNGIKSRRDLEDLLDAADEIVVREELALEDDY